MGAVLHSAYPSEYVPVLDYEPGKYGCIRISHKACVAALFSHRFIESTKQKTMFRDSEPRHAPTDADSLRCEVQARCRRGGLHVALRSIRRDVPGAFADLPILEKMTIAKIPREYRRSLLNYCFCNGHGELQSVCCATRKP